MLFIDTSKYALSTVLTQEYTTSISGKELDHQHQITYVSGLLQGSQLDWAQLMKEECAIYMSIRKLSLYLTDASITIDHISYTFKKILSKATLNAKVNNWSVELSDYNITFKFVKGVKSFIADTPLMLTDLDLTEHNTSEMEGHGYGYALMEPLQDIKISNKSTTISFQTGASIETSN